MQGLLTETGSVVQIKPERIGASSFYDPIYIFALISCVIHKMGKKVTQNDGSDVLAMNSTQLRFVAFCAARPYLIQDLERWCASPQQPSLFELQDLSFPPSSFLMDTTVSDSLLFLISTGNLSRYGEGFGSVSLSVRESLMLNKVYNLLVQENLLANERYAIELVAAMKISLKDLGFTK